MSYFSIIIPTHNNAENVGDAIESVKEQLHHDWQCILIDDYSTDNTVRVIQEQIEADYRFSLLKNNKHKGANVCRNTGIDYSEGEYLIFLDADDILLSCCLKNREARLQNSRHPDMLVSPSIHYDKITQEALNTFKPKKNVSIREIIISFIEHKILWTTTSVSWKKNFLINIGGWNEKYPRLQDVELNIRALLHSPEIAYVETADSYLQKSTFTVQKQKDAFIGFNLLLRDYYAPVLDSGQEESFKFRYHLAFMSLIRATAEYQNRLGLEPGNEWVKYFNDTVNDIEKRPNFF